MRKLFPRSTRRSLGLVMLADGLALAQASAPAHGSLHIQHWHWLALHDAPKMQHSLLTGWPDPSWLRLARQQAGCAAKDAALAIDEARLRRFSLQLQSGLNVREQVKAIELELQRQLPWPLSDTVWDFHCLAEPKSPTAAEPHQRPDWLVAAMQAQAVQHVEVLATQRAWVAACEHWCRAAGLWLVRLEPAWQAEQRWQRLSQPASNTAAQVLAPEVQARVGGLALGVLKP
jgi:Tfp pilus assembly PilM family ATPase